ncbi:hypothetical protein D8674_012000 [Pyrus ussuriensis x Pyrus communis]|uniref:Uncharacterized protein n=1 Tax=Pyrus ussuriensis x Pyrus communis TaxID=2448454 RepID=A0A5N5G5V5_9ROSA|nr:hypothetical protein D8674_012000 [Pyrus ussuriensis x Pyrus communis]
MASNTFITKLSEECTKCKDFSDRNAIKTLHTKWKTLGIYDGIKLLTIEIVMDQKLFPMALSFWCSATNTMVLPLGPSLLDISAILGTSLSSLLVDTILLGYQFDLELKSLFDEQRECREAEREFQERCMKLHLRPNVPETYSTSTFDAVKKIFGNRPKKASAPKSKEASQVGCSIKRADTAATVAAKKKPAPPKKTATVESLAAFLTPMAATTVASTKELQNPQMDQATQVQPTFPVVVEPIDAPLVEGPAIPGPVVTPTIGSITATSVVETASQVNPSVAEANTGHETTPIHPQDQNLGILPQKCLNDLAAGGLLSTKSVVHISNILEQTRQYFTTFERALRAKDDLKAAKITHEASRLEVEAIKAKKTLLANLDHQIVKLQHQIAELQR